MCSHFPRGVYGPFQCARWSSTESFLNLAVSLVSLQLQTFRLTALTLPYEELQRTLTPGHMLHVDLGASFTARLLERERVCFACTFLLAPALRFPLRFRCTHCSGVPSPRSPLPTLHSASFLCSVLIGCASIQGRYHPAGAPMPDKLS